MTIHVLVEGPSEKVFFDRWAPRLRLGHEVEVHPHQGKGALPPDLDSTPNPRARGVLDQLPAKLRAYATALNPQADGVLVLVDADDDTAEDLAQAIQNAAAHCAPALRVKVCVAVEETEAYYLGDLEALKRAYPWADMATARAYVPDSICGTWELFGRVVADGGGNKVAWAERMGPRLTTQPARSRSPSFKVMVRQLRGLVPTPAAPAKKRRYRHPARPGKQGEGKR